MKEFQDWLNSDNVIKTGENEYKTQCSQYTIPMTLLELKKYYLKEFTERTLVPEKDAIVEYLKQEYQEDDLHQKVSDTIHNYLDEDWEDEFDDEDEAYQETGRGEAESEVRTELEKDLLERLGLPSGSMEGGYEFYCELIGENVWDTIQEIFSFLDT